jgi:2-polyprenyl-3-methyl-5-hydroxy-6-metoxy-1,4-benzoquinol methylase
MFMVIIVDMFHNVVSILSSALIIYPMNEKSINEKYLFKPYKGSSHSWAIQEALALPRTVKVLDIGFGTGALGSVLKDNGFKELYGVEIDDEARAQGEHIYNKTCATLDLFLESQFDLILILDVLEHLSNPIDLFSKAASLLSPSGVMLISVPNVTHWSVRIPLFFGYFKYYDRGILDKTHLRFFTTHLLHELILQEKNVKILNTSYSIPPLQFALPKTVWDNKFFDFLTDIHTAFASMLPGLFGYQVLCKVCSTKF